MRVVLRVRKKGVIILPKSLREALSVKEGDELLAEVKDGKLVIKPLRPKIADVDPEAVERLLREERIREEERYVRLVRNAVGTGHWSTS